MSESAASVFTHPRGPASATENICSTAPNLAEGSRRRQQSQQPRQLLSCTKCRERKVKCDRTKPCSACCARGAPKDCHFIAEGGDYAPIQQSYELRKLRAENLRLKERLRTCKIPIEEDEDNLADSPDSPLGERPSSSSQKRRTAKQRRFQGSEWSDSIYFGSPGLANVITDFASVNLTPISTQSLAHLMPRGSEMYTPENPPPHPFATLFKATPEQCIPELLGCLPPRKELLEYLAFFEKRVSVCSFPHVPLEITKSEVERFLANDNGEKNAHMCPDMLALLFAALALGSQHSVWDKSGGQWDADVMNKELQKGNVYIAAAMQALRMASFMHKPTLLGIQALIMIGPFLTNSGRFLDAWTLFGMTIRLAQSIGLHRHPKYLDPAPPTQRECFIRQTLWWWMLHMDQQYSMTLGRPLGISGLGDCPPPHELTTDPRILRFGEFVNHFTVLARQILSSDRLTNAKIDEFTDMLKGLLDTMPEMLQFDESWLDKSKEIPEWPLGNMAAVYYCKTHNYLILLNRQRSEKQSSTPNMASAMTPVSMMGPPQPSPTASTKETLRGRSLVLSSSEDLLTAFLFFYYRIPAALICWTMGQQAFNSCMILLLNAMETGDLARIRKVEMAYAVFKELENKGVHKLASLAVEKVSWGLDELRRMQEKVQSCGDGGSSARTAVSGRAMSPDMQGVAAREADSGAEPMHDTVMGNTGMLLLEDPGLQSFVPEAFAPLTWAAAGDEMAPAAVQSRRKGPDSQRGRRRVDASGVHERGCDARSLGRMQRAPGWAPGSARMRCAVLSAGTAPAPQQEPVQPQGLTPPTSPPPRPRPRPPPPRHHYSYHSPPHRQPAPLAPHPPPCSSARPSSRPRQRPTPVPNAGTPSTGTRPALANNSSTPAPASRAGPLSHYPYPSRLGPEYALVSASHATHHAANPSVHPSWAARPAAPLLSTASEPTADSPMAGIPIIQALAANDFDPSHPTYQCRPFALNTQPPSSVPAASGTEAGRMQVERGFWEQGRWTG